MDEIAQYNRWQALADADALFTRPNLGSWLRYRSGDGIITDD